MSNRIFIRCPNWLGDIIMSIPAISAIKKIFPDHKLYCYARKEYVSILKRVENVTEIIGFEKKTVLSEIYNNVNNIKKYNFEKAIVFPNSWTSALIPFLAQIPERYGYNVRGRGILFTNSIELPHHIHELHHVYYYLGLVRGIKNMDFNDMPKLNVSDEEVYEFKKGFSLLDKKTCCFVPGAAYGPAKCWFKERYMELGKKLVQRGYTIILVGGKDDEVICEDIKIGIQDCVISLAGKTKIDELPVVLKSCNFTISNDSGPMHVSAAVGTPVIGIFGSTNPKTTYPFGYRDLVIHKELECSYCLDRECKLKVNRMKCMELITVTDVINKLEEKGLI
ncbi:MAG: lipopolysaccharide heptosyltransferase II [Proteobacteria bacterium]|nr:lipopolysaccharide heptosyltransferase II [Pseudomonadota bacterium]